jgi:hypothetical protein
MDNPSHVLIDIYRLDTTPADHDRVLENKVNAFLSRMSP